MSNTLENHVSIEILSRTRTKGSVENFTSYLDSQVTFSQKPSKSYFMRIENIQIPKSYYDIDSNFNTFRVIETAGTYNITITPGNYTITELLTVLEAELDTGSAANGDTNTWTLTYDDIANKVTIQFVAGGTATIDTIANGSTLNQLLGFGKADTTNITGGDTTTVLATGVDSEAPNGLDLHTKSIIAIETDITSNNYYNQNGQNHIGARVPMLVDRNQVQFFANHEGHLTKINNRGPLSQITLTLYDEFRNIINLNEVDWSCEVNFYAMTENHKN